MYETFDHTADVGLRITAPDLNTLFSDAARGLFSLIVENVDEVLPAEVLRMRIEGTDRCYLLFDWLNELLFKFETERLVLSRFDVTVGQAGLEAVVAGETADTSRHRLDHEVKAITYSGLKVERSGAGWLAEVILDI